MNRLLRTFLVGWLFLLMAALALSCASQPKTNAPEVPLGTATPQVAVSLVPTQKPTPTRPASPLPISPLPSSPIAIPTLQAVPVYTYEIVNAYPHDPDAFTQGLIYQDGVLYEGTGLRGRSTLRRVALETGEVLQSIDLPPQLFGEGVTVFGDKVYQLTWQSNVGLVYDKDSFELIQEFHYPTEGWGLTHDDARLIMSDGTATLHFLDPETLDEIDQVQVIDPNGPVFRLNELEYIQGEVCANIWQTDRIARIDPRTGQVTGWIDLSGLLKPEDHSQPVDVLNGIAYDAENDRLFVTGKLWPRLFEIVLVAPDE